MQIPGAVSFYWQPLFTILRTSEYASYFSPILAGFEHRNRKNCLKNHGLPDRAKTSIFVTSAPRASFWPSLTKFHFWLLPSLGDSEAKLVLKGVLSRGLKFAVFRSIQCAKIIAWYLIARISTKCSCSIIEKLSNEIYRASKP